VPILASGSSTSFLLLGSFSTLADALAGGLVFSTLGFFSLDEGSTLEAVDTSVLAFINNKSSKLVHELLKKIINNYQLRLFKLKKKEIKHFYDDF
jgi:hypothetical protein